MMNGKTYCFNKVKGNKVVKSNNSLKSFESSLFSSKFQGVLKNEIIGVSKANVKISIEPFFVLSLSLTKNMCSLGDLLDNHFEEKKVNNDSKAANTIKATKYYFEKLPEMLVIQVKAFYYDKDKQVVVKKEGEVSCENKLTIEDSFMSPGNVGQSYGLRASFSVSSYCA